MIGKTGLAPVSAPLRATVTTYTTYQQEGKEELRVTARLLLLGLTSSVDTLLNRSLYGSLLQFLYLVA